MKHIDNGQSCGGLSLRSALSYQIAHLQLRRPVAMLASLFLHLGVAYILWSFACLEVNVRKARALGVPVVRVPFGGDSYIWFTLQPLLWAVLDRTPIPWTSYPDFIRFSRRNWHFLEKSKPTARFGTVWALVSPTSISLHFSDPNDIEEIYSRWRSFIRPVHKYRKLMPVSVP